MDKIIFRQTGKTRVSSCKFLHDRVKDGTIKLPKVGFIKRFFYLYFNKDGMG